LGAEHISVIDLQELFGGKGFRRAKDHASRVVDDDIKAAVFLNDSLDGLMR
jgi:hypothetical protein